MGKIDLNQKPNSRERLLFVLVLFIVIFLGMRVLNGPQAKKRKALDGKIQSLVMEKNALIKFKDLNILPKPRSLSRSKGVKIKILMGEVTPSYQKVTDLLAQLARPEFLRGVTVQTLNYLPPTSQEGYTRTDFTIKIRGNFSDILHYIERLEQFPALFHLESLTLQVVSGQPQEVESEIVGRFFRLSEVKSATAQAQGGSL